MATTRARLYWLTYPAGLAALLAYDYFSGHPDYWVTGLIWTAGGLSVAAARRYGGALRGDGE